MEQGTIRFLKDRNYTLAGRKVELVVADTGGNPAGTKTKTQELVERDHVDMIIGPLAAFELLAITDYTAQAKMPVLSLAAAEDMTQRRPNPYFVRASGHLGPVHAPAGRLRGQGAEAQARDHDRRRLRLRLRADGRLPAGLRGCGRPGREEAVAADRDARLHAVSRPDQRRRRRRPGLRRIEPAQLHEAVPGRRAQAADPGRRAGLRRGAAEELRRRGDRPDLLLGLHGRPRHAEQQAAHRGHGEGLRQYPRALLRRPLHQRHGGRGGAREDGRQDRRPGSVHQGAARGVADRHAARPVPLRPLRQRRRQLLHPPVRQDRRQARQHDDQDLSRR